MLLLGVAAHGGADSPESLSDGCRAACEAAFRVLEAGGGALEAAVAGARLLEDDGRYNAGRGSVLRLDGRTVEMDAGVMDSSGNVGLVMAVRNVRNPSLLARAVADSPHVALAGEGAEAYARMLGLEPFDGPSETALRKYERVKRLAREGRAGRLSPRWKGRDIKDYWNFPEPFGGTMADTIGVVALDRSGRFAVANSTGGASPMMLGRVGDSAMPGCGLFAGGACAVSATGIGEEIIRRMLARAVHDRVEGGMGVERACREAVALIPPEFSAGVIALSREGFGVSSNTSMAHFFMGEEE
ncbi:MAG: isoaspartyl peptidase/L-asparaginase [Thermodesulfovibrionales bacterium]